MPITYKPNSTRTPTNTVAPLLQFRLAVRLFCTRNSF